MNAKLERCRTRLLQSGNAAIEFAFVFPLLLTVAYGGIVYGYVFFLQQSINFAAQQGAQAAVATVPTSIAAATSAAHGTSALAAVKATLYWLPADQTTRISVATNGTGCYAAGTAAPANSVTVQVTFALAGLFPVLLDMPMGIGTVPPLPTTLQSCAVAYT